MAIDIKKLQEKARQTGKDFTKTTDGSGDGYQPPPAGPCNLRFVGYFEIGEHERQFKGETKRVKQIQLVFELSGKNYPPKDGVPVRMTVTEADSQHVKANIVKLFNKMNYEGKAKHFAELIGNAYRGRVYHREYEVNGQKRVHAGLRNDDGYSITPPVVEVLDDATGDVVVKPIKVAEPLTELKLFLWDNPDMEQWTSIYIDGEYPERRDDNGKVTSPARSKNVVQDKIKSALNWIGSPMQLLLEEGELGDPDGDDAPAAPPPAKKTKKPLSPARTTKERGVARPDPDDDDDPMGDLSSYRLADLDALN